MKTESEYRVKIIPQKLASSYEDNREQEEWLNSHGVNGFRLIRAETAGTTMWLIMERKVEIEEGE